VIAPIHAQGQRGARGVAPPQTPPKPLIADAKPVRSCESLASGRLPNTRLIRDNAHVALYVEVKDEKGVPTLWAMEATGHGGLQRVGVKRKDLKVGDAVKVRCHLLRDGSVPRMKVNGRDTM
jgi:hypothetical protein